MHVTQIHPRILSLLLQGLHVLMTFITALVRNHKFTPRILQFSHNTNGMLNTFSRNDSRGLQNQDIIRRNPQMRTHILRVCGRIASRILEIQHVRNQNRNQSFAPGQFVTCGTVDGRMLYIWKRRGECHIQVILDRIHQKT